MLKNCCITYAENYEPHPTDVPRFSGKFTIFKICPKCNTRLAMLFERIDFLGGNYDVLFHGVKKA